MKRKPLISLVCPLLLIPMGASAQRDGDGPQDGDGPPPPDGPQLISLRPVIQFLEMGIHLTQVARNGHYMLWSV